MRAKGSRGSWVAPLVLIVVGVILLLSNFLLLGGFNAWRLAPLLLVIAGAVILVRGDLLAGGDGRTFGITRGSVEAAALEISAGEIDVRLSALQREGRLIAGVFAADSKPDLYTADNHVTLRMDRAATPWLAFNDWDVSVATDLPWRVYVSTHLGEVDLNLDGIIVQEAVVGTGLGSIRLILPQEAFAPIRLRSTLGDIRVLTPPDCHARIHVSGSPLFRTHVNNQRYKQETSGVYVADSLEEPITTVEVYVSGTFGDAYLA